MWTLDFAVRRMAYTALYVSGRCRHAIVAAPRWAAGTRERSGKSRGTSCCWYRTHYDPAVASRRSAGRLRRSTAVGTGGAPSSAVGMAWSQGKWRDCALLRVRPAVAVSPAVPSYSDESEREIYDSSSAETGFDLYWRLYFASRSPGNDDDAGIVVVTYNSGGGHRRCLDACAALRDASSCGRR